MCMQGCQSCAIAVWGESISAAHTGCSYDTIMRMPTYDTRYDDLDKVFGLCREPAWVGAPQCHEHAHHDVVIMRTPML